MEKAKIKNIVEKLSEVKGLANALLLKEKDRDIILNMENENNEGIHSCLDRQFTLMLTHDSSFREPEGEIVKEKNEQVNFPGVPFSEVDAKNVVSGSPGEEVHDFLVKRFNLELGDDATLLVGFDL